MNEEIQRHYLETSIYTYAGAYKDFLLSLPDEIPSIGRWVCDQITHPSMYFTEPSPYLEGSYFGKFASYPKRRFKNEDELYITAVSMLAGILYLNGGDEGRKDVTKRITVSCRQASVLFSAILKAKGIPCRSRAGLGLRRHTLDKKLDVFTPDLLQGVCGYLFMDFHALMNNEIFYSYQPLYLRDGIQSLGEPELRELDELAELLREPDENRERIKEMWEHNEKLSVLTNNTQNIYEDVFR